MGSAEKITDRELKELERKVSSVYRDAAADVSRICNEYWTTGSPEQPSYQQRLQTMQERLAAGEITKEYYRQWVRNNIGRGERWNTLRDEISRRAATANQVAAAYINDTTPGIYSLNANRTAYAIEQTDVGAGLDFVLVNEQAVRNLVMGNNQYEFRTVRPDRQRDYAWNSEKIERQLTLGILAGDSVKHMTDRFMTVMGSNRKAAIRNARTAITSAQNAGSLHTMQAARDKGIDCKKEWLATTSDNLTRDAHLLMDGIRVELDDDFPIGLAYPGDPKGDPAEVYNCRCTMITIFPGINDMKTDDDGNEITYEEWLADKMERGLMPPTRESDDDTAGDISAETEQVEIDHATFENVPGLPEENRAIMESTLASCDHQVVKDIFLKYQDQLCVLDSECRSGAVFDHNFGGIRYNAESDKKGGLIQYPGGVAFHEFGHMLDWILGGSKKGFNYASVDIGLVDILKSDFQAFKRSLGVTKAADVIPILKREKMTLMERACISDILERFTRVNHPLGTGHGYSYHKDKDYTGLEFFAEVIESATSNPESFAQMKRLFPNGVQKVFDMLQQDLEG